MTTWDERFRRGEYPRNPDPSPLLERFVEAFPEGPALDVATGTGRNAVFLAGEGYAVDAVDRSREGLRIARENAALDGVEGRLNPIQADLSSYSFPTDRYAVATASFYRVVDRLPDVVESLVDGGYLLVEHHLRSTEPTPSGAPDRYRFAANELLHACLGLTVLHYDEGAEEREDGRRATARIVARNTAGTRQAYPRRRD